MLVPCTTFRSIFLPPSPSVGRDSSSENQGHKKAPERRDLSPGWVQGTNAAPLWRLRVGGCSPQGWLRGELGSQVLSVGPFMTTFQELY